MGPAAAARGPCVPVRPRRRAHRHGQRSCRRRGSRCSTRSSADRAEREGTTFVPFDPVRDYDEYIDGKQRYDGVRSFLASRGIELPEGSRGRCPRRRHDRRPRQPQERARPRHDPQPRRAGVRGIGALRRRGPGGRPAPRGRLRERQLPRGAARRPASPICSRRAIDGIVAEREQPARESRPRTRSSPPPGSRRAAGARRRCSRTRLPASRPDEPGGFGFVVGVDRVGQADALASHGADVVVSDLAELLEPA